MSKSILESGKRGCRPLNEPTPEPVIITASGGTFEAKVFMDATDGAGQYREALAGVTSQGCARGFDFVVRVDANRTPLHGIDPARTARRHRRGR